MARHLKQIFAIENVNISRLITVAALWLIAVIPLWHGGKTTATIFWPLYRRGDLKFLFQDSAGFTYLFPAYTIPGIGSSKSFYLHGGEIVAFTFGCLVVAAGFIAAGCFIAFKRSDNASSRD